MISQNTNNKIRVFLVGFLSTVTTTVHSSLAYTYNLLTNSQLISPVPAALVASALPTPQPSPNPTQSPQADCKVSDTFTQEVKAWESDICRWSKEQQQDPDIIATIMQIESCGNNFAVSSTGVKGLFQVTGANLAGANGFDPNASAAAGPGKVFKASLTAANGNIHAAMAGYNGGGWAREYIAGQMSRSQFIASLRSHYLWRTQAKALAKVNEVERYAQWANIYFEAKENKTDTLNTWLNLGGYRLCNDAAVQLGYAPRYSKETPDSPVIVASDSHAR